MLVCVFPISVKAAHGSLEPLEVVRIHHRELGSAQPVGLDGIVWSRA